MQNKKMFRKSIVFGMFLMLVFAGLVILSSNVSADDFAGGTGTEGDPYQIADVYQLQNMNLHLDAHYILINNIDASDTVTWNSGAGFEPINWFEGAFDGDGYKITDLYINRPSARPVGLIGTLWDGAELKNVKLHDIDVTGYREVGGLVGYTDGSSISSCYTTGSVTGNREVGGLVGCTDGSSISSCYTTGSVTGNREVGGLVGYNSDSSISSCYSTSSVTGSDSEVGGLVGSSLMGSISNCYATGSVTGSVTGNSYTGGLVGYTDGSISNCYATGSVTGTDRIGGLASHNGGSISGCYATGSVTGNDYTGGLVGINWLGGSISDSYATGCVSASGSYIGGLVGENVASPASNCFWDTETSGQSTSASGTGKTTAEMKNVATFTDTDTEGLDSSWDFVDDPYDDTGKEDIWDISTTVNDGYPYLSWQITNQPPIADANGPYAAYKGFDIIFNASDSSDPENDELQYRWDFENDGTWDTDYSANPTATQSWTTDYTGTVKVEVYDGAITDTDTATVIVEDITTVKLIDSTGAPLSGGIVKYYDSGWKDFGTTDTDGIATNPLPAGTYHFRMTYEGKTQQKNSINVGINPVITYQTILTTIQLKDSNNNPIDTGTVKYYASGWKTIGDTIGGQVTKELLPGSYHFKMEYEGKTQQQNNIDIETTPTITFQTIPVTVQLLESDDAPIEGAEVRYYASGWKDMGTTDTNGQTTMEMMPGTYHFRVTYAGKTQQQNNIDITTTPTITFQTQIVTVELKDSGTNIPSDLVALWHMDEGTGDTIYDETENNNDGTIDGATWTTGKYGNALSFVDDYVEVPDDDSLDITNELTIEAWMYINGNTGDHQTIMGKWYNDGVHDHSYLFETTSDGKRLRANFGGSIGRFDSSVEYNFNEWIHAAMTYDGSQIKFYLNGDEADSAGRSGTIPSTNSPILIGAHDCTTDRNYFNGKLDNVAIYNRALTATEIEEHYNNGISTVNPLNGGTVQYYASGWKTFGTGTTGDDGDGKVTMELLPGSYHFRMTYAGETQQINNIEITTTPIITYQTGKVHSNSNNVTQYYASGWKTFTQDMELLPYTYKFKYNDGTQKQFTIDAGKINYID